MTHLEQLTEWLPPRLTTDVEHLRAFTPQMGERHDVKPASGIRSVGSGLTARLGRQMSMIAHINATGGLRDETHLSPASAPRWPLHATARDCLGVY